MRSDTTSKRIILASIIVIISCFLPWWGLFSEFIPNSGENAYIIFVSNPFFDSFLKVFFFGQDTFDLTNGLSGFVGDNAASIVLLVAVIITLVGGALGIISLGNKKIALIAAGLVLVGVLIYIICLAVGQLPGLVNPEYFTDNGLNPIFGTHVRSVLFGKTSDTFGINIGPILAGLAGLALLILAFKSTKTSY
jgi:hypothetical protein